MELASLPEPVIRAAQLLLVLLVERFIEIPQAYHPLNLFRLLGRNMGRKVNPYQRRNSAHQLLAGGLAPMMLILPLVVLLYFLLAFAEHPWFFETLILWCIIQSRPLLDSARRIQSNLAKSHKLLAREQLSPLMLRETERLSPMGITKASVEMLSLRLPKQYFAPILWFMLLGALPALLIALIQQLAWHWNTKLTRFRYFGQPVSRLSRLFNWLPNHLLALNISLLYNTRSGLLQGYRQAKHWGSCSSGVVLAATAWALKRSLGGPAIYQGQKVRRAHVGNQIQVQNDDITSTIRIYQQVTLTWVAVILMSVLISLLLNGAVIR